MKNRSLTPFRMLSCLSLAFLLASGEARAVWLDPAAGWQGEYNASSGLPTATTPAWTNGGMIASVDTTGDGGNPTLRMDMDASNAGGIYYGPGNGTVDDQITIDFRLGAMDTTLGPDVMQFHLRVYRPVLWGGSHMWTYQFGKSKLKVEGNNETAVTFAEGWHNWRITIDMTTLKSSVYLDGSSQPIITHHGPAYSLTTVRNRVEFGRNNSSVLGEAALTYLRWTNSQIVVSAPTGVAGTASVEGYRGDNASVGVKLELTPTQGGEPITRYTTLDATGHFQLEAIPAGDYHLVAKAYASLSAATTVTVVDGSLTVLPEPIVLQGTDSNGDNIVSFEDFALLQNSYGQGGTSASPLAAAASGGCGSLGLLILSGLGLAVLGLRSE